MSAIKHNAVTDDIRQLTRQLEARGAINQELVANINSVLSEPSSRKRERLWDKISDGFLKLATTLRKENEQCQ
jgi:hypothetical protein